MDVPVSPHIVSVSRRTDIPAFFGREFLEMLESGHASVRSPFGGKTYDVDLRPEAVSCLVFWSKNFQPFFPVLDMLDRRGDALYFLYTITGLARGDTKSLEPGIPDPEAAIRSLRQLSERYSPKQVSWRFDPIVLCSRTPVRYWLDTFAELAVELHNQVHRCIFSFCDYYRKVPQQMALAGLSDWEFREGSADEKTEVVEGLIQIARKHNLRLETCCEDAWALGNIERGSCVDASYLAKIFPGRNVPQRHRPTREECGCWESRDIGAYATCQAACPYCYAS